MNTNKTLILSFDPKSRAVPQRISSKQLDNLTRSVTVRLGSELPDDAVVTLRGTKPDSTVFDIAASRNTKGQYIFPLTENALAAAGEIICDVHCSFTENGVLKSCSTETFFIDNISAAVDPNGKESTSELQSIPTQVKKAIDEAIERGVIQDGVTFTPVLDANGSLSWTNDGGLENPKTINIQGKSIYISAIGTSIDGKETTVTFSDGTSIKIKNGENGENGTATDEQVETYINAWLDSHPEAVTNIADGSITPEKISNAVILRRQVFDPEVWNAESEVNGIFLNSPYIPVEAGKTYTWNYIPPVYYQSPVFDFYDANKQKVTSINKAKTFTVPDGCSYIKFSLYSWDKTIWPDKVMLCEGEEVFDHYFVGTEIAIPWLDVPASIRDNSLPGEKLIDRNTDAKKLKIHSVTEKEIDRVDPDSIIGCDFTNLFDVSRYDLSAAEDTENVKIGYFNVSAPVPNGDSKYKTLVLHCKPNTTYRITHASGNGFFAFYDIDGNLISVENLGYVTKFTTPEGTYQTWIPFLATSIGDGSTFMQVEGEEIPEIYEPYRCRPHWLDTRSAFANFKVICYGDSLTASQYPSRVAELLSIPVTDAGVGGNTLNAIHGRIGSYGTDFSVVTLMCGTNDNGGVTTCPLGTVDDEAATDENAAAADTTYASRLKRLINKIKAVHPGATYILMPPFSHDWADMKDVAKLMGEIAEDYAIPYLNINALCGWRGTDEADKAIYMADGTHENSVGAQRIAELLAGYIKMLKGI